jgi:class 3 adenylate cyclase/ribonuclease BN (tRNA processing enzyme)
MTPGQHRNAADLRIRVLGCSGAIAQGCRTTSFLIDDNILIDAGTGVGDLTQEEIARIDHIFLSHSHLDHVLGVGLLADTGLRLRQARKRPPVQVYALPQTLQALRQHILNDVVWPDFTRIPSAEHPALAFVEFALGQRLQVSGRHIEVLPAEHTVPAVGFAVSAAPQAPAWVYTGDTGPNPALWKRLATLTVHTLVIETAFSNDEEALARVSQHLCPTTLKRELSGLAGDVNVLITHIKPGEVDAVMRQVLNHNPRVRALVTGEVLSIPDPAGPQPGASAPPPDAASAGMADTPGATQTPPASKSISPPHSLWQSVRRGAEQSTALAKPYIATAAVIAVFAEPLFWWVWGVWMPQPFESLSWRLAISAICLPLVWHERWPARLQSWLPLYWHTAVLVTVPFHFCLMLLANQFSTAWLLSVLSGAVVLALLLPTVAAITSFALGAFLAAYSAPLFFDTSSEVTSLPPELLVVYAFTLGTVGLISHRVTLARTAQQRSDRRARQLAEMNSRLMKEHNEILGHFLNNSVVSRLQALESEVGIGDALGTLTRRQTRFCATLQADIRGFSQLVVPNNEIAVAQLVSSCYDEVTTIGQDLAVIKPIGDCLFVYSDFEQTREESVLNLFCLACVFVDSVAQANATRARALGLPDLNVGIGLHAGSVVYGNISSATLVDPTVVGVNVNLTARLEELSKAAPVARRLGPNAIILSREAMWMIRRTGFHLPGLQVLDLPKMGVTVRDFLDVEQVYGLPQAGALALVPQAREHIRQARLSRAARRAAPTPIGGASSHQGISYTAEMVGSGPRLTWCVSIRVSKWPEEQVWQALQRMQHDRPELPAVRASLRTLAQALFPDSSAGDLGLSTDWLELRTQDPGEHDELDAHALAQAYIDSLRIAQV